MNLKCDNDNTIHNLHESGLGLGQHSFIHSNHLHLKYSMLSLVSLIHLYSALH